MKLLTPFLMIVAAIGLFFLFIKPHYENISNLRSLSMQYDQNIDRAKVAVSKKDQLLAKKNSYNPEDIKRLQKFLPDTVDPVRLIIDMNGVINNHGSSIRDIKVTADTAPKQTQIGADQRQYGTALLGFTVSMTYDEFNNFLKDLEKSLRLIDIDSITFHPADQSSIYDFNVTVRTYWLK